MGGGFFPRNVRTFFKSFQRSPFFVWFRNINAGWNVGIRGIPSNFCHSPLSFVMAGVFPNKPFTDVAPRAIITFGFRIAICCFKNGIQISISAGVGLRLSGGRHFRILPIKTSSLLYPIAVIIFVRKLPDRPTKGCPSSSSFAPGASPMNIISGLLLPCPGTVLVLPWDKEHFVQAFICAVISSILVAFSMMVVIGSCLVSGFIVVFCFVFGGIVDCVVCNLFAVCCVFAFVNFSVIS